MVVDHPNGPVDDQAGVHHLGRVEGLRANALPLLHKHAVAAVHAAAHDEVGHHGPFAVGALADDDAPAGIGRRADGLACGLNHVVILLTWVVV